MGRPRRRGRGVGDRLTRMSMEQRRQYLDKRAAQEQENARRREELVAAFLKAKLEDEMRLGRTNEAKLNVKWRVILRKTKKTSVRVQLEAAAVGATEAAAAQDRLAALLRAQLGQAQLHRARAHDTHVRTVDTLTRVHEEHLQALTTHLRAAQARVLQGAGRNLQQVCRDFLQQLYRLHLSAAAARRQHDAEQRAAGDLHRDTLNLLEAQKEAEAEEDASAKRIAVQAEQDAVRALQEEQQLETGPLQAECEQLQKKRDETARALQEIQRRLATMKAALVTAAEEPTDVTSAVAEEKQRIAAATALLRAAGARVEQGADHAIRAANRRAEAARKRLQAALQSGRSLLQIWGHCCALQTGQDTLLPYLPPHPACVAPAVCVTAPPESEPPSTSAVPGAATRRPLPRQTVSGSVCSADSGLGSSLGSDREQQWLERQKRSLDTALRKDDAALSTQEKANGASSSNAGTDESCGLARLLEDECFARSAAGAEQGATDGAPIHDYALQQAESILLSHEAASSLTRQLQAVRLQRQQLRAAEGQLRDCLNNLTKCARSRLMREGASDAAQADSITPPLQVRGLTREATGRRQRGSTECGAYGDERRQQSSQVGE